MPQPDRSPIASTAFARATYRQRTIGLALGLLTIVPVLFEQAAPWWVWAGPMVHAFAWPHLAWHLSRHSADPSQRERKNLVIDHFAGGMWTAAVAFSLLPSVLMASLMAMGSMVAGGPRQVVRGLGAHAVGVLAGLLVFGVHWQPVSSLLTILCSLPVLVAHPLGVSFVAHRMLEKLGRQREELAHLSRHDDLTGLYNRRHWEQLVKTEYARFARHGQAAALVLIDLDHFKRINDTRGHDAGDRVLRRFAELLRTSLRDLDMPGRYGGEEFGVLMPQTGARDAAVAMEHLRQRLREASLLEGERITASFGVAALGPGLSSHAAWISLADQMLYSAKHRGRDRVETADEPPITPPDTARRASTQPPPSAPTAAPAPLARWKPSVTVAAIIERDGRFLLVEEHTPEGLRLNNPAGHLEPGESPAQGCAREALEETARVFRPTALVGVYLSRFQRPATGEDVTYLRFAFCGEVGEVLAERALDDGIVRTVWLTPAEIRASVERHRSPLLLRCMDDYLAGRRYPLDTVFTDASVLGPGAG